MAATSSSSLRMPLSSSQGGGGVADAGPRQYRPCHTKPRWGRTLGFIEEVTNWRRWMAAIEWGNRWRRLGHGLSGDQQRWKEPAMAGAAATTAASLEETQERGKREEIIIE